MVNPKAKFAIQNSGLSGYELVPIIVNGEKDKFWILNVISVIDCLDHEKTKILYSADDPGRILNVKKPVIRKDVEVTTDFVKIPEDLGRFFVKRSIIDLVLEHQLTGIYFEDPATEIFSTRQPLFGTPIGGHAYSMFKEA